MFQEIIPSSGNALLLPGNRLLEGKHMADAIANPAIIIKTVTKTASTTTPTGEESCNKLQ